MTRMRVFTRSEIMAIVMEMARTSEGRRRLCLQSPATRKAIGEILVDGEADVKCALLRARKAQEDWAATPIEVRAAIIGKAMDILQRRKEEVIATVLSESGKTRLEALMFEILPAFDAMNYWSHRATRDLADEKRPLHGYMKPAKRLLMHFKPLGVVGVIVPWNGPFSLAMVFSTQALLAGNAVLLKPSEVTPASSAIAAEILWEAGVPKDLLTVLHGDGETGAALVNAGVDKISFTGSIETGRRVAKACAEQGIPCTLELGGKDAMIVCADADLKRAAAGAVFSACVNSGHVCVSVERIYVVEGVADEFIANVESVMAQLRCGSGDDADIGAIFTDRQLTIIRSHVEDAKRRGARVLVGGETLEGPGLYFAPTLLTDVNHEMEVMTKETFGPIVAIMRVKDEADAIRHANDSPYGLSGSVWTKDQEKGIRIAKQMKAGSVVINDASIVFGVPEAPFGGVKASGLGYANGPGALRSYCQEVPILIQRWNTDREPTWYPAQAKAALSVERLIKFAFGSKLMRKLMS